MAKKGSEQNGRDRLEEAIAMHIQNEAAFLSRLAENDSRMTENERAASERFARIEKEVSERFARIEKDMSAILRVLSEHSRLLERLPEAVREKIGFQRP